MIFYDVVRGVVATPQMGVPKRVLGYQHLVAPPQVHPGVATPQCVVGCELYVVSTNR